MDTRRRGTIIEEATETLLEHNEIGKGKKKLTFKQRIGSFGKSIYNHELREFVGRDGKAWCLLGFFYSIFYLLLSCFFLILLYIFYLTVDPIQPTFYDKTSAMSHGGHLFPGLGFRPQPDPESNLIKVDDTNEKLLRSLDVFLDKYEKLKKKTVVMSKVTNRTSSFDYNLIINGTPCAREKHFGFDEASPCVIIKINKIYGWIPEPFDIPPSEAFVGNLTEKEQKIANETKFLWVSCEGEYAFDKDQLFGEIDYYSEFPSRKIGGVKINHYPYRNQANYLSPLVFAHFRGVTKDTLVKVRCRLWAKNMGEKDEYNLKGMTEFDFYVQPKKVNSTSSN